MGVQAREVDPTKEKEVLERITWRLDKLENDTLPQVDLNVTEVRGREREREGEKEGAKSCLRIHT